MAAKLVKTKTPAIVNAMSTNVAERSRTSHHQRRSAGWESPANPHFLLRADTRGHRERISET